MRAASPSRAFDYRAGVRVRGTVLACDATAGRDLTFVSGALIATRGVRQALLTETTLALLGRAGERLRRTALLSATGRPFSVGPVRVELFPSGHLPGAASLLVEAAGRRIVYAGAVAPGRPLLGAAPLEIRAADALCIDAAFAHPRFAFPPADEAITALVAFVSEVLAAGRTPVLLAAPLPTALEAARALAKAGVALRAHRSIMAAAALARAAGIDVPTLARFAGRLAPGQALLLPPAAPGPALTRLTSPVLALVSGLAQDEAARAAVGADVGIALSPHADREGLLAYVAATGAREVATVGRFAEDLAATLRDRGCDAYALGPPRQVDLFRG